jgi:hypothetical protein
MESIKLFPHKPTKGFHMASHDWATWHHTISPKYATCQNMTHPRISQHIFHVIVRSYGLHGRLLHQQVGTIQLAKSLYVWKNEQNIISFTYGVRLSPFKLCWVCNDEACAHIHFEVILRTFIFRLSWTHFGSWIHFGSYLPTKTFWSSKRILTSHQVRDRPPHLFSIFKLCHMHFSHQDQL